MTSNFDIKKIATKEVPVVFMQMNDRPAVAFALLNDTRFDLLQKPVSISDYRSYYYGVGKEWQWVDRMIIADDELLKKINDPNTEIYLMYVNNQKAGFAEFVREFEFTEIQYFGLFPDFVGKGLSKYFLQWVINKAWSTNPSRIQLNTCGFDHPNAIAVYQKAGFNIVRTETQPRNYVSQ